MKSYRTEVVTAITGGKPDFGTWKQIFTGSMTENEENMCLSR